MPIPHTTSDNPGAFQSVSIKKRIRSSIKNSVKNILVGDIKSGVLGISSASKNILDFYLTRKPSKYRCSCCGFITPSFIHKSDSLRIAWNSICANCGSRSRHRGLVLLIPRLLLEYPGIKNVLHFAPEPVISVIFIDRIGFSYETTDLYCSDVDFPGEDIRSLSFESSSFDMVICNHILEHLEEDSSAVAEIGRILSPGGIAVITIPGKWDRETSITFSDPTNNGHYRDYGLDVINMFSKYFSVVTMRDLNDLDGAPDGFSYGIRPGDCAFICQK